ncbi:MULTISPECIES: SDR family NAD(P)-dependent oxidoreductase [Sphingobium]|uniref:SDR family NAD(P)-dependent oxidoreductase n=1 Tax=Sphingobium TaxID=165695 RepID=UPI0015EC2D6E|nr:MULTISPECIES: SDR family oxidoreductase [Sphingobium]MCW2362315.1 NAD(P)-dependent dehydrogenase (short-subunit alcohol dehydrogenase family) [Sphingobium sp. B10D3B]MCW2401006.1 NAD(P)-dependent dehydrogenase (short-subunit alcohol dehydrogenase family) [Sphingobium sp. B10D7B]MCW2407985.1 NAD(P)-dependent dehydrogenase (short-subunit alcohol dehydrogenase family) [Sphingobium xanthum]
MNKSEQTQYAVYPSLAGKNVLVTGGATGIGAAIVAAFAGQGAHVAFLDFNDIAGADLARDLAGARFRHCDLRNVAELDRTVRALESEMGGFDVLVNNAANDDRHRYDEVTADYWDERMATNLRHQFFAAQAVVPAMRARGGGAVINLGSVSWHLGMSELVLYQTAKAGVEGMTRALARDLGGDNIRVTAIVPGNVDTPRQKQWYTPEGEAEILQAQCLPRRIQPRDVAALALFLASDDGALCSGHEYFVDAGWR